MRSGVLFWVALAGLISFASGADRAQAASESVIHAFSGGTDGGLPFGGLIKVGGSLYGTTTQGGATTCNDPAGCGTVFKVTKGGIETVLHSFIINAKEKDGLDPTGELTRVGRAFFGAAQDGYFHSEIFRVNSAGSLKVLHIFGNGEGQFPNDLIDAGGALYGTTLQGGGTGCGGYGCGTVFRIGTNGVVKVLYTFQGGADGAYPDAGLVDVDRTLYGTTSGGGSAGGGTVFKVTTGGVEAVVYSFQGGADGSAPKGLLDVAGTFYGATVYGGTANLGTVFKVTTNGIEKVLYSFQGGSDGSIPNGSLIKVGGALYGTTEIGGQAGSGTVFKVTTKGAETVLHSFTGGSDGSSPNGELIDAGGTVFGTTGGGGGTGCGGSGCGTVFQVTP
jgi:uncharacterized repeat protein (TIGR03803 family)